MEIKTKYNIDDTIFFMYNNTPKKATITGIKTFTGGERFSSGKIISSPDDGKKPCVYYYVAGFNDITITESESFQTKEDLIENIFSKLDS